VAISIIENAHCILLNKRLSTDYTIQVRKEILAKLAKYNDKDEIIESIFAPSLPTYYKTMEILERELKSALYNSVCYLELLYSAYDLRRLSNRLQYFLDSNHPPAAALLNLKAQKIRQILEGETDSTTSSEFNVEECKVNLDRVWIFIKQILLSSETQNVNQNHSLQVDSYDDKNGILVKDNKSLKFQRESLRGKIMGLLHPDGKPSYEPVSFEDIYYGAIKGSADPEWYDLTSEEIKRNNDKIYEACDGINERTQEKISMHVIEVNNTSVILL